MDTPPQEPAPQNASQACPLTPPADEPIDPVVVAYLSDSRAVEFGERITGAVVHEPGEEDGGE